MKVIYFIQLLSFNHFVPQNIQMHQIIEIQYDYKILKKEKMKKEMNGWHGNSQIMEEHSCEIGDVIKVMEECMNKNVQNKNVFHCGECAGLPLERYEIIR